MGMASFQKKDLAPPKRVCLRLKECREYRGISLSEVAKRTRISQKYLEALESCRFEDIPFGIIYQKNFIKRYALAIHASPDEFLRQYLQEEVVKEDKTAPNLHSSTQRHLSNMPLVVRSAAIIASVLFAIGYLGFQVKQSIEPPLLSVFSPPDGFIVHDPEIKGQGTTEKETQVFINDEPIITNDEGIFEERMYLSP